MSAAELMQWWAFYQMSPWGEERADIRMGMNMATTVNMWSKPGKRAKPADFIPDYFKPHMRPKRQDANQMLAILRRGTEQTGIIKQATPSEM